MEYLKIKNYGTLYLRSFFLIGASTKKNDSSKIGQFGTGLKYAVSYFMREGVNFKLFIGTEEVKFELRNETLRDTSFDVIYCNDQSMNITTEYGYQWGAWEALREIWCNAKDEEKFHKNVKKGTGVISGEPNWTTFFIETTQDIKEVIANWGKYFIANKPIFENEDLAIYENTDSSNVNIYKNGVLVKEIAVPSLFNYDIKKCELNELRQYMGNPYWVVPYLLANTNKAIVSRYIDFVSKKADRKKKYFEDDFDWSWAWNMPNSETLKKNFSGFIFLHPDSTASGSSRVVKINKDLFESLKSAGLPCERVDKSSGSYYGGSGGNAKDIKFKLVNDEDLIERIQRIMKNNDKEVPFETAIPFGEPFEVVIEFQKLIFSSELSVLSDADLEAVVLIGIVSKYENTIYKAFKRLMKANLKNENLHKILFNENQ